MKHHITLAGPDLLSVGSGDAAREVLHRVQREASFQEYMKITVPEDCAANVLYINGTIVHRSETEAPHSYQVFDTQNVCILYNLKHSQSILNSYLN